jgi:hypothetical protein
MVLSTLTSHSSLPTVSDLVCACASKRFQVPSRLQRTKLVNNLHHRAGDSPLT